ncbi:hypothetical protein HC928_02310 [bacterium]|nr:hypothetical protein [bacterium]
MSELDDLRAEVERLRAEVAAAAELLAGDRSLSVLRDEALAALAYHRAGGGMRVAKPPAMSVGVAKLVEESTRAVDALQAKLQSLATKEK